MASPGMECKIEHTARAYVERRTFAEHFLYEWKDVRAICASGDADNKHATYGEALM